MQEVVIGIKGQQDRRSENVRRANRARDRRSGMDRREHVAVMKKRNAWETRNDRPI